jgi:hypothetical protein
MCLRFEAGSNFFLWLLGRPHDPVSMQTLYSVRGFRQPRRAPLSEMWRYVRVEQTAQASGRQVSPSEYDAPFLDWARAYLGEEYDKVTQRGEGIAQACGIKWQAAAQAGREASFYKKLDVEGEAVVLSGRSQAVHRSAGTLEKQNGSPEPQHEMQLPMPISTGVSASATKLPPPTYKEHRAQCNRSFNYTRYGIKIREFWDGQDVKAESNGTVRLFISSSRPALILRASKAAAKLIRESGNQAKIHSQQTRCHSL